MKPLEVKDANSMSDHRKPLVRALKVASWALVVLTVVALMGWGAARDLPGIWAALMGVAVGGSFVLLTAVTVLATSPAFTSAWVTVYDAVQVTESPGASGPVGHSTVSILASLTRTRVTVTLPVLVTVNV